jgi:hypothetical protein
MPLSSEGQGLFDHARRSLPRWLTKGKNTALEWLYGYVAVFESAYIQGLEWYSLTKIQVASGAYLDQHAIDRGTVRRLGETDSALRSRLRSITDAVTVVALKQSIDLLLASSGLGTCTILNLRPNRAHFQLVGSSSAFLSRGYRMTNADRPMTYLVILPFGSTSAIGKSVEELLRLLGPAGYISLVEIRQSP